jgi:hypothetical protein
VALYFIEKIKIEDIYVIIAGNFTKKMIFTMTWHTILFYLLSKMIENAV